MYKADNKSTTKLEWRVANPGVNDFPDEMANLTRFGYVASHTLDFLIMCVQDQKDKKYFADNCKYFFNQLKEIYDNLLYLYKPQPLISGLYIKRLELRVKNILNKVNAGKTLNEAFAPYEWDSEKKQYKNSQLFLLTEYEFEDELGLESILLFDNWNHKQFFIKDREPLIALIYVKRFKSMNPRSFIILFFNLMKEIEDIRKNFSSVMSDLSSEQTQALIEVFLVEEKNRIFLHQNKLLLPFLISFAMTHANAGMILIEEKSLLKKISQLLEINSFFDFLKMLTLEETPLFQEAKLNPATDYFRALLLFNFDYQCCLNPVLSNFDKLQTQATLLLYEALAQGDKKSAEKLVKVSQNHHIKKLEVTQKNSVDGSKGTSVIKEKSTKHEQIITFNDTIAFSLSEFLVYLRQKYILSSSKEELYFLKYLNEFTSTLSQLGLIDAIPDFIKNMTNMFSLPENSSIDVDRSDLKSSKRIRELEESIGDLKGKVGRLEDENSELGTEVSKLKNHVSNLEKTNTSLQNQVENLQSQFLELQKILLSLQTPQQGSTFFQMFKQNPR